MRAASSNGDSGDPSDELSRYLTRLAEELAADGIDLGGDAQGTLTPDGALSALRESVRDMKQSWLELDDQLVHCSATYCSRAVRFAVGITMRSIHDR